MRGGGEKYWRIETTEGEMLGRREQRGMAQNGGAGVGIHTSARRSGGVFSFTMGSLVFRNTQACMKDHAASLRAAEKDTSGTCRGSKLHFALLGYARHAGSCEEGCQDGL